MNTNIETKIQLQPLEVRVGIDTYATQSCIDYLKTYYQELRTVRSWLMTHTDNQEESATLLESFRTAYEPIHTALHACSPTQRNLLELTYSEQKSPKLVRHEVQCSTEDVDRNLFQAFQTLTAHPALQEILTG